MHPDLVTWIYNDNKNNIILELTPIWPWHFDNPEEGETFITYEKFMKNYQSYLTRIISKDVAEQWVQQCKEALNIIDPENYDLKP